MKNSRFPAHLLDASADERIKYFNQFMANHPLFNRVLNEILDAIMSQEKEPLIFVFGPSHVGKSTLVTMIEKKLLANSLPELESDLERIPFASVEAIAHGYGNFRWKDYYSRALAALKEPLIDKKILYADESGQSMYGARGSTAAQRRALEKTLSYRKPFVFIIDEAQHLAKVSKGKLEDQLDCIKSLANTTGVKHLLLGTYDLLAFRNQSAQLNNRSKDIHFPRYNPRVPEDVAIFKNIVGTFERYVPVPVIPDLIQHYIFLMERTIGCVGTLKLWITRALRVALMNDCETITKEHLEETAPSIEKALKMAEEALEGEIALSDNEEKRDRLLILLGMALGDTDSDQKTLGNNGGNKQNKGWRFRPGKPNPKRYPIGDNNNGGANSAAG